MSGSGGNGGGYSTLYGATITNGGAGASGAAGVAITKNAHTLTWVSGSARVYGAIV